MENRKSYFEKVEYKKEWSDKEFNEVKRKLNELLVTGSLKSVKGFKNCDNSMAYTSSTSCAMFGVCSDNIYTKSEKFLDYVAIIDKDVPNNIVCFFEDGSKDFLSNLQYYEEPNKTKVDKMVKELEEKNVLLEELKPIVLSFDKKIYNVKIDRELAAKNYGISFNSYYSEILNIFYRNNENHKFVDDILQVWNYQKEKGLIYQPNPQKPTKRINGAAFVQAIEKQIKDNNKKIESIKATFKNIDKVLLKIKEIEKAIKEVQQEDRDVLKLYQYSISYQLVKDLYLN